MIFIKDSKKREEGASLSDEQTSRLQGVCISDPFNLGWIFENF